ncbi:MAG TPA: HD domain-containing protein, partial [Acidimicrobiales bacterium]|nr:HD domain-containing protein [Acidimicrobiales bacterium]
MTGEPSEVTDVAGIVALYEAGGQRAYGERITITSHSVQCAELARDDGAADPLVAAALLHDIGHLIADEQEDVDFRPDQDDDHHEAVGARVLAAVFGPVVARPVALHVQAKRWRCTVQPAYLDELSELSTASLKAQGGLLDDEERRRFEAHPGFDEAVSLRGWDDRAKVVDVRVPPLGTYVELLES